MSWLVDLATASMVELQAAVKAFPGTQANLLAQKMFEAGVVGKDLLEVSDPDDPEVLRSFLRESVLCEASPFVVARLHSCLHHGRAAASALPPPPPQGSLGAVTCEELADAIQAVPGRDSDNLAHTVRLAGVTGADVSQFVQGVANDPREVVNLFAKCEAATLKPFVVTRVLRMLKTRWGFQNVDTKTSAVEDAPANKESEPIGATTDSSDMLPDNSTTVLVQARDERRQLKQSPLTHAPDLPKIGVEQGSAAAESCRAGTSTTDRVITKLQSASKHNTSHSVTSTTSKYNPSHQEGGARGGGGGGGGGGGEGDKVVEVTKDVLDQRCPTPEPWPPSLMYDYAPTDDATADSVMVATNELEPRAIFAVFTELIVQKIPNFLRRLFRNLWSYRYDGEEWLNEPKFGNLLLNGRADFSHLLGSADIVSGRRSRVVVVDGDVRFFRDRPGEEGVRPGTRVCLELGAARQYFWVQTVKKVDSDEGVKTRIRVDGTFTAPGAVKHVNVYVQPREFFDRQTRGNSSARYREIQKSLLSGNLNDWDMTALMWVLLFSAHNTDARNHNAGFVHARRHAATTAANNKEGHDFEEDLDARMKQLRAGLDELRVLRNSLQHHRTCQYSPQDFHRGVLKVTRVMRGMDHLASRLGWRWTLPEEEESHQPPHTAACGAAADDDAGQVASPVTSSAAEELFLVLSQLVENECARSLASGPGGALELTNKILALKKQMDDEQDRYAEKIRHLERHKRNLERHHQLSQKLRHMDRYSGLRVRRRLAVGRQAIVLHCSLTFGTKEEEDVALKVFWPEDVESSSSLSLLYKEPGRREIDILSNLSPHDNVVNPLAHLTSQLTLEIIAKMPRHRRHSAFSFAGSRHSCLDAEGLVMELYDGSLADFHKRFTAVAPQTWLDIGIQVLQGVHHYSRSGIVHFDLKLDNILFKFDESSEKPATPGMSPGGCVANADSDGGGGGGGGGGAAAAALFSDKVRVAISDFGAAFNEGQHLSPAKELSVYSFNVDKLFGNKAHRAPEVLAGIDNVKKSRTLSPNKKYLVDLSKNDIFAAGVVLAEMVLGHHPVASDTNGSKYGSHSRSYDSIQHYKLEEDLAQLSDLVSPKFENVVRGLLDFDPSRRMPLARAINILQAEEKSMMPSASAHEIQPALGLDSTEQLSDSDDFDHLLLEEDEDDDDDASSNVLGAEDLRHKLKWDVTHSMWRDDDSKLFFDEQTHKYTRDPASGDFLSADAVAAIQSDVAQKYQRREQAYSSLVNEAEALAKDEPEALDAEEDDVVVVDDDDDDDDDADGGSIGQFEDEHGRELSDRGSTIPDDLSGGGGATANRADKQNANSIPLEATDHPRPHNVHPKHKTEPCMYWITDFRCFRGGFEPAPGCPYAHGPKEFRGVSWEKACARLGVAAADLDAFSKGCGDDSAWPRASTKTDPNNSLRNLAQVQRDDVHRLLDIARPTGIAENALPAQFRNHFNRPLNLGGGSISRFMQLVGNVRVEDSLQAGRIERIYHLSYHPSVEHQQLQQQRVIELLEQAGCEGIEANAFETAFRRKFRVPFQCGSHESVYSALTSSFPFARLCVDGAGQHMYCSREAARSLQRRRVIELLRTANVEARMLGSEFGNRFRQRYKCKIMLDEGQRMAEALALIDGIEVVPAPEFHDKWIQLARSPQFHRAPAVPVSGRDLSRSGTAVPVSGRDLSRRIESVLLRAGPDGLLASQFQPAFESMYGYKLEHPDRSLSELVEGCSEQVDIIRPQQSGLRDNLLRHADFRNDFLPPRTKKLEYKKCRSKFGSTGFCKHGDGCRYAHSDEELVLCKRVLPQRHPGRSPAVSRRTSTASSSPSPSSNEPGRWHSFQQQHQHQHHHHRHFS